MAKENPENIQCPTCGYYCLGKGGFGCIDKPSLQDKEKAKFVEQTVVRGQDKHRWECPVCKENKEPQYRFNLSPDKDGKTHKCRFCKTELKL